MIRTALIFACGFAAAFAYHPELHHGPEHRPIITKAGVPLETQAVRDAKIHHQIAHEVAAQRQGYDNQIYNDYQDDGYGYGYARRYAGDEDRYATYQSYHGPKHYPIITKAGVPLETPAVRDARIHHHIAKEVAARRSYDHGNYRGEDGGYYGGEGRYGYGYQIRHDRYHNDY